MSQQMRSFYFRKGRDPDEVYQRLSEISEELGIGTNPSELLAMIAGGALEVRPAMPGGIKQPPVRFINRLTAEIQSFEGDIKLVSTHEVKEFLRMATVGFDFLPGVDVMLYRRIEPGILQPHYYVEVEGGEEKLLLFAADIDALRALLLSIDESQPVQVGEALTIPTRLEDGRVTMVVTEEMLK